MNEHDLPRRTHYLFALRDELPLDAQGWSVHLHWPSCSPGGQPHPTVAPTCTPQTCAGLRCRFVQVAGTSDSLAVAVGDMSVVLAGLNGEHIETPAYPDAPIPHFRTIVDVSAPLIGDTEEASSEHYERCMQLVYDAGKALRLATGARIPHLTLERMWPMYMIADQQADGGVTVRQLVVVPHGGLPGGPHATVTQLQQAAGLLEAAALQHPVEIYQDFRLTCITAMEANGDYIQAVLAAATAAEVLIKHTAWLLTWEAANHSQEDPHPGAATNSTALAGRPSQLLGRVLSSRLGGNWSTQRADLPVAAWRMHIARRRNSIIHLGYRPSAVEAMAAREALFQLEQHIFSRLATSTQYPITAFSMLGQVELEHRGVYERIRNLLPNGNPREWLSDYQQWLDAQGIAPSDD